LVITCKVGPDWFYSLTALVGIESLHEKSLITRGRGVAWVRGIANALFDATGVRLQEYPLTPKRVLAALNRG
jgi:hypothetical protein